MLKKFALACVLVAGSAIPALADSSSCSEPIAPAPIDGSTATQAQMKGAQQDVMNFLKASDDYQGCLYNDLHDQKMAAQKAKKDLDPSIEAAVNAKVDANQKLKEKVGGEFNTAVGAYKAAHPGG
jgi:hypothetical protein